jgi:ABC-type multidrug transport system ATPase subunit
VDEVLDLVGLAGAARKRAGRFSLGMAQRLGIAAALLGDPPVLLLDEPVNGLDPAGIHWIRDLLKSLAGRAEWCFVSSHLISEMALMVEHLVVIGQGRLLATPRRRPLGRRSVPGGRVPATDRRQHQYRGHPEVPSARPRKGRSAQGGLIMDRAHEARVGRPLPGSGTSHEWNEYKLRSLRSTWWTLAITAAGAVAMAVVIGVNTMSKSADLTNNVLAGVVPGLLLIRCARRADRDQRVLHRA